MALNRATMDIASQKIMNGWMNERTSERCGLGCRFYELDKTLFKLHTYVRNMRAIQFNWITGTHTHGAAAISRISQMLEFILLISTIYFHLFRNFTTRDNSVLKSTSCWPFLRLILLSHVFYFTEMRFFLVIFFLSFCSLHIYSSTHLVLATIN